MLVFLRYITPMDDIRRPSQQRREFAMRNRGYVPRQNMTDLRQAAQPAPVPAPTPVQPSLDSFDSAPAVQTVPQSVAVPYEQFYSPYTPPRPAPPAPVKRGRWNLLKFLPLKYAVPGIAIIVLVAAAGFMLTRPPKTSGFTATQLAKKAGFSFFYPQPMPAGYSYELKFNAFQDGQVYFMLAKGNQHIVFHEQAAHGALDTSALTSVRKLQSPTGQAAIGYQAGQPAAKLLTRSTLISVNSTGQVSEDDLAKILNLLKSSP